MKNLLFLLGLLGLAVAGQARVLKQVHHDSDNYDFSSPGRGLKQARSCSSHSDCNRTEVCAEDPGRGSNEGTCLDLGVPVNFNPSFPSSRGLKQVRSSCSSHSDCNRTSVCAEDPGRGSNEGVCVDLGVPVNFNPVFPSSRGLKQEPTYLARLFNGQPVNDPSGITSQGSSRGLKQDIAFGRRLKDASCSSDSDCPSDQVCVRYVGASENTCHDDPDFF